MKEKFIAFLKERKIYNTYSRLVFAEWGLTPDEFLQSELPRNYVTYAFKWDETEDGTKYWAAVDELWKILNDDFKN